MTKASKRRGLGYGLVLTAAAALALASPALASAAASTSAASTAHGHAPAAVSSGQAAAAAAARGISGVDGAMGIAAEQTPPPPEPAFNGTPPLLFNGSGGAADCVFAPCDNGDVMMTPATGAVTLTPIFWDPTGHTMAPGYKGIITQYLADVAQASGQDTNVFSVLNEYSGNNGQIHYNIRLGTPINDKNPLPADGCTLAADDTTGIYGDGSGYSACLDDAQLQTEINNVTAARGLPHNLSNIYIIYTAKGVESCFNPGSTTSTAGGQFCTINHQPTAAYCAYHSTSTSDAVYANLSYPIYASPVGFTCGSDARFPVIESPNHNPDADTEVSPTSHEVSEAITDPDTETGWYDRTGNEIGDDCAYIYGATNGQAGALYNQTIAGGHFITQQEFSNNVFSASGGTAGCVDSQAAEG